MDGLSQKHYKINTSQLLLVGNLVIIYKGQWSYYTRSLIEKQLQVKLKYIYYHQQVISMTKVMLKVPTSVVNTKVEAPNVADQLIYTLI